ncbi:PfkB family carbohydrate kinase (Mak32) [Paracoccidioides lutzii Pb01]|uniref:PfkB family carbohydrate kinase (Mak32) n=1 Tax=Paracoccidioides lutzii (strain ATCC MYA-826 / Pb01) TaxID=502779 RepID=C1HA06_PARBA|nr:PfkB family carbohydrate kinase (Mak32) [Paracoccidioides lutzii Pb01]EEH37179.2 PfkB family carbohydrate kinase (Mak32) [Paracoccidioides lutzii Pb01]
MSVLLGNINFCTLGMFIIDEIEFEAPKPSVKNIIGGAGSYAAVGARMVAGKEHSRVVSWIVDTGSDFPDEIRRIITSWDSACVLRESAERLTTRAWNGYGPNEKRDFRYLTPKLPLDHNSLSEYQVFSKSFHLVCSPARCCQIVEGILQRRDILLKSKKINPSTVGQRPVFVWEPVPDLCREEELPMFYKALKHVDVVSPNDLELANMFGNTTWNEEKSSDRAIASTIIESGIGQDGNGLLVVRAGKGGSYAFSKNLSLHIPAYNGVKVVDPTGAGNAFLGALAQGLVVSIDRPPIRVVTSTLEKSEKWTRISDSWGGHGRIPAALICATVAASFVIEQVGVPQISCTDLGEELWNGESYTERVRLYTLQFARNLVKASEMQK